MFVAKVVTARENILNILSDLQNIFGLFLFGFRTSCDLHIA